MAAEVLLHVCCGPCAAYPREALAGEGFALQGYFANPNIHPFREHQRRREAAEQWAAAVGLPLTVDDDYDLEGWLRMVAFRETERCRLCWHRRLEQTARLARDRGCDFFTTSLLYSRYQDHEELRRLGEALAHEFDVPFLYRDFRVGWQRGLETAKAMGLYRQSYCGCVYSERDRYRKPRPEGA